MVSFVLYRMIQVDLNLDTMAIYHIIIKLDKILEAEKQNDIEKNVTKFLQEKTKNVNGSRTLLGREILSPQVSLIIKQRIGLILFQSHT